MWSYLATKSLISLLPDSVENKVALPKVLGLDELIIMILRFDRIASFGRAKAYCTLRYSLSEE